jgi:trehalose 6-phosphate phosphatase
VSAPPRWAEALGPWLDDPVRAGVFTDFDGTLAPIVDDPETADALPGAVEMLGRLADRYGRVAVVSGRSARYLQQHLRLPDDDVGARLTLAGLYGLERVEGGQLVVRPDAEEWAPVVERVGEAAEAAAPDGVGVERKGLTLTLHARRARGQLGWIEDFARDQGARTGLEVGVGKMSFELRPPIDVDKGTVVDDLAAGLRAVCFAGDDVGDLPAFAALDRLRAAGVATLAVAARSSESPPALLDAADVVVDGPEGVLELFARLAGG